MIPFERQPDQRRVPIPRGPIPFYGFPPDTDDPVEWEHEPEKRPGVSWRGFCLALLGEAFIIGAIIAILHYANLIDLWGKP
jgi:hypothetical protein